jgi:hypothetical protein
VLGGGVLNNATLAGHAVAMFSRRGRVGGLWWQKGAARSVGTGDSVGSLWDWRWLSMARTARRPMTVRGRVVVVF